MPQPDAFPIPRAALFFMATIDEARRTNEGPFRAIAPLFQFALDPQRGQILNLQSAITYLNPILGDGFTIHALEAFLPQLVKIGWLVEEKANNNLAAYRVPAELPSFDDVEAIEASAAKIGRLHETFQTYLANTSPLFSISMTKQDFAWQIFRWATSLDGSDKEAIRTEAAQIKRGSTPSVRGSYLDEPQRYSRVDKSISVIFAGFVRWLVKNARPEIQDIISLTELGLAVEFLDELRVPSDFRRSEIATLFILDSPVLLDLLGLSGTAREKGIATCLEALKNCGAQFATLSHCLEELTDILNSVLARPQSQRFGLTGDAMRENRQLVERARQITRSPDKAVKALGIQVVSFDPNSPINAIRFPSEAIDKFRNAATWHEYYKTEQRQRDALSIAFVMRRRNGRYNSDFFDNSAALVTRNSMFTTFSKMFVKDVLRVPEYAAGPAIETKTLAALVWVQFGSTVSSELPHLHLLSACDRILAANGELLRRAEKKIKDLQSEEVATALLSSHQAVLDLVVASGGNPDVIDAADGEELLRSFTRSAEELGRSKERDEISNELTSLKQIIAERDQASELLKSKSLSAEIEKIKAVEKANHFEKELEKKRSQELLRAKKIAEDTVASVEFRWWAIVYGLIVTCLAVSIIGQFFIWNGSSWWLESTSNFVVGAIVIISTILTAAVGLSCLPPEKASLADKTYKMLVNRTLRKRLNKLPVDDEQRLVHMALEQQVYQR